jgi:undecaprenyl-diphosphatase
MGLATFFFFLVRKKIMTVAMLLLALVNAWTRLYLGQHYLSDICIGLLWGVVSGILAWQVYKKYSQGRPDFNNSDPLIVATVFFATVILTMVYCI